MKSWPTVNKANWTSEIFDLENDLIHQSLSVLLRILLRLTESFKPVPSHDSGEISFQF